jgi:peptidyl-prolyl cis-trans isomerase B (cyclophilin B)
MTHGTSARRWPCTLTFAVTIAAAIALGLTAAPSAVRGADHPFARIETDAGTILVALYPELAPHHVDQFLRFARSDFYVGTYFHRIEPGFVIQGGDPNTKDDDPSNDGTGGPTLADIGLLTDEQLACIAAVNEVLAPKGYVTFEHANLRAEFSATAHHRRGTLAMARSGHPDSGGSQFYICVAPQPRLDRQYTIFGQVVTGLDVVDAIVSAQQDPNRGRGQPAVPVQIVAITALDSAAGLTAAERAAYEALPEQP